MEVLREISESEQFLRQPRNPRLSDLELIGVNLTAEYLGIDSEHDLFRKLPVSLSTKVERSVYNRRRRKLFVHIEHIRCCIVRHFNEFENVFVVDSMPLEVCKLSRSDRSKICKEQFYSRPDKGYCASQSSTYYGYKLHAVCSVQGIFQSIDTVSYTHLTLPTIA